MAETKSLPNPTLLDATGDEDDLVDCRICGRHFATNRIETHEWICQKQKKRKPFDVAQQRVRGTEAEQYYKKNRNRVRVEKSTGLPPKNWRKEHEDFVQSMRAAREMTAHLKSGGNLKDLPPPPRSDYSDYIQCPHCQRKFNNAAAERHIPKCAEMQHRPKPIPVKSPSRSVTPKKVLSARK